MQLTSKLDPDRNGARVIPVTLACLFLDLDGTLAPIAQRPDDVGPQPARTALLRRTQTALGYRLAVVSGRSLAEVDRILENAVASVAGLHGLERRSPDGRVATPPPAPGLEAARHSAHAFARENDLLLEDKGLSIALHYRLAPDRRDTVEAFARRAAAEHRLTLQAGKMVFELRTPGADKGDVVHTFMTEPPFRGGVPLFIGDDLTDEHGFEAAHALGGYGILVGPARDTRAAFRLETVDAVLGWIEQALTTGAFTLGGET